jgi:predicted DNA-binding ribbon-helix-helix protein
MKPPKPSPGADTELASDWYNYGLAVGAHRLRIGAGQMSIAKTTRPHLLTREAAAARIEALEAALEKMAADSDVELTQLTHAVADNIRKIETLEAALRACVQYHVKAAADCRAIAAVNQDNDLGENSLNHAVDHEIAAEDIGDIVRAALAPEQDK